jgi:prepilin-type N-terminal cleavage/methylation domain-containing protein
MNRIFHSKNSLSQGFTLVEILVALTIVGGGMFILVNSHYSALQLHVMTVDEVDARVLLENTIARAEMGIAAKETSGEGDFGTRYPGYRWSYEAQEVGGEENPVLQDTVFYRVKATLNRPDGESKSLEFLTFSNAEMQTVQQTSNPQPK